MSQGSINQSTPQHAGIEGILAALQAVHQVYGIDTEKQRQQLLASQIKQEEPKNIEADARASELKNFIEGGGPGRFMLKDAGYMDDPNAQAQPQRPIAVPAKDVMASNDAVTSDAVPQSPLKGHTQKISDFDQPQAGVSTSVPGARTVSLPGGGTTTMVPGFSLREQQQKYQNDVLTGQQKQLEIQKLGQEMGLAAQEARRKGTGELDAVREKFLSQEPVKAAREQAIGAQNISKALLSGNEISEQMAQSQLPMLALGVKRLSGSVISEAESKQTLDVIKNLISQKGTGHLTPKELSLLNNAARTVEQSSIQQLDSLGNDAAQAAANAGIPKGADFIKNKIFFPQGLKSVVPVTRVKIHPETGKASIFAQSKPGTWSLVSSEE